MIKTFLHKINNRWTKLRLQPIRVFCFHQVSEEYVDTLYCRPDWMSTNFLKNYLLEMKRNGYQFVSLLEAHRHIQRDIFRRKKLAVLTADDGLKCQVDILPWLQEQQIPLTLFLNVKSVYGNYCGRPIRNWFNFQNLDDEKNEVARLYLTKDDLKLLPIECVSVGLHGIEHEGPVTELSEEQFEQDVDYCIAEFGHDRRYVPFYAYVYGKYTDSTTKILHQKHLIPVLSDGQKNYNDASCIHREILEVEFQKWQQKYL